MLNIGCHLSVSKGFENMGKEALSINANTFQFFTRNPRGGKAKDLDDKDIQAFLEIAKENKFAKLLAHAPYTLNACAADESKREFAIQTFADDLRRLEAVPGNLYNFHPGSHVKQGVEIGIDYIKIVATLPLNNFGGLAISRIINDIDDYVIIVEIYGDDFIKRRGKYKIYYNNDESYIKINNIKFYLNEFMI